jgi:flagellar motor protein MotB
MTFVLSVVAHLGGCNSKSLKDENALLMEENQTLRSQLEDRNAALDATNQELRDRNIELSNLKRKGEEGDLRAAPAGPTGFEGIAGVTGSMGAGEVTATVESDILFDSGQAKLKAGARRTLEQVAQVLNSSYAGKSIRISGHTDSDPIRKSGHKSNHHLGFERSWAVYEFLRERGVPKDRMYLASYGPDKPLGSKAKSRRVEIVVVLN